MSHTMYSLTVVGIVFGSIFVYGLMIGVTWATYSEDIRDDVGLSPLQHVGAFLWPIVLPTLIGILLARRLARPSIPRAVARDRKTS